MLWMISNSMRVRVLGLVEECSKSYFRIESRGAKLLNVLKLFESRILILWAVRPTPCQQPSRQWACAFLDLPRTRPSPQPRCENVSKQQKQSKFAWRRISALEIY